MLNSVVIAYTLIVYYYYFLHHLVKNGVTFNWPLHLSFHKFSICKIKNHYYVPHNMNFVPHFIK